MTDYVLAGLTKRRAELTGEAETLRARLAQIGTDLGHLDAVIRQFNPDYDMGSIRPKRPRGPDVAGRGEMSRFILDVLREAAVLHGSPTSIFNDLSYTENAFRPQIGADCIGICDFTR